MGNRLHFRWVENKESLSWRRRAPTMSAEYQANSRITYSSQQPALSIYQSTTYAGIVQKHSNQMIFKTR